MKFSKEQLQAIYETGRNILVSASAGSGKTTVLIERIINKIKNEQLNVDELLVVTFTEASAKEMKLRLRAKLLEELKENPHNHHLKKQLMLIPNANISTFHAFCNQMIKKYFYLIDVESKYQIAQTVELFIVEEEVLEKLFEQLYEEQDKSFLLLIDRFTKSRNDDDLKQIVLDLYHRLRNIPNREEYLKDVLNTYESLEDLSQFKYNKELYGAIKRQVLRAEHAFQTAYQLASDPFVDHAYQDLFVQDKQIIDKLMDLIDQQAFDAIYSYLQDLSFGRFSSKASKNANDEIKQLIKTLRDKGKDTITKDIKQKYFSFREKSQVKFIKENKQVMEALIDFIKRFDEAFKAEKRSRSWVDFSDLEEFALLILDSKNGDNEARKNYQATFKEILIDEYQDTNSMQEAIISRISRGDNVFTVGDVKQSIYRFRNAEPEIFQDKYTRYGKENSQDGLLINLNANYRSREAVIDFINYLFHQIMDEEIGEIAYDDLAELKAGATYYPEVTDPLIHFTIIDQEDVLEDEEENWHKIEIEAHYVGQTIRKMIDEGRLVYDKHVDELRPIRYSDIVILSRTVSNDQGVYNDVFKQYNVPLLVSDVAGYFDSIEVRTVMSLLEVIDNPLQDIPLVAVLRSPLYNIGEKELVQIEAKSKEDVIKANYFYDKVKHYIKVGSNQYLTEKLVYFMNQLHYYREFIRNHSLSELLFSIYHETNYYDFVRGQIGGRQRQANLDLLFDRAKEYEQLAANSLYRFVQLINFLKENDKDLEQARTVSENEDLVRFMSIHKSKGLEFPVVFVVNLSKRYNMKDLSKPVLFDKELGITFSYLDINYRVEYPSLYQSIIKDKMQQKVIAEEMRLLYVALTRAKERLYLVGSVKNPDTYLMKYQDVWHQAEQLIDPTLRTTTNYLDLIIMAMMRHPVFISLYRDEETTEFHNLFSQFPQVEYEVIKDLDFHISFEAQTTEEKGTSNIHPSVFKERLFFQYPYQSKTTHFAKMNISDIKRLHQTSPYSYEEQVSVLRTPKFIDEVDRTARGTSYHRFMQHIDYRKDYSESLIQSLKQQLMTNEILTEEEASWIKEKDILNYLSQSFVQTFKEAQFIKQELPFTTLIEANKVYHNYEHEDDVLVQGVMDLIVGFNDKVYLIDFKTDRIKNTKEAIAYIQATYRTQIAYYKEALQAMHPDLDVEAYLYLFEIEEFIPM